MAWEITTELFTKPKDLKFQRDAIGTQPKVQENFHKISPLTLGSMNFARLEQIINQFLLNFYRFYKYHSQAQL